MPRRAGLLIANDHLDVIAADRLFLDLASRDEPEVVGHPVADAFGGADKVRDVLLESLLFEKTRDNFLVRWKHGDGSTSVARLSVAPVRLTHDEKDGLFVSVEDLG